MPNQTLKSTLTAQSLVAYGLSLCLDGERHALAGHCAESNLCYKSAVGLFECAQGQKSPLAEEVKAAMRAAKPPCCKTNHLARRLLSLIDRQCMIFEVSRITGSLQFLTQAYCDNQHFDLAAPLLELELSLVESSAPNGLAAAQTLERLAQCFDSAGRSSDAKSARQRAQEILE